MISLGVFWVTLVPYVSSLDGGVIYPSPMFLASSPMFHLPKVIEKHFLISLPQRQQCTGCNPLRDNDMGGRKATFIRMHWGFQ